MRPCSRLYLFSAGSYLQKDVMSPDDLLNLAPKPKYAQTNEHRNQNKHRTPKPKYAQFISIPQACGIAGHTTNHRSCSSLNFILSWDVKQSAVFKDKKSLKRKYCCVREFKKHSKSIYGVKISKLSMLICLFVGGGHIINKQMR